MKMSFIAVACSAAVLISPAKAEYKNDLNSADARLVTSSLRTLQLVFDDIADQAPGLSISVGIIAKAKENDDEDSSDSTLSCHGDSEAEAINCSEMLNTIIEVLMEDPDKWICESTETGANCQHQPH